MKQILFLILFISLFVIPTQAQRKPTKTTVKPAPQKIQEVTTQKAIIESGKVVILKSNGTWEFAPVEISKQPEVKRCDLTLKDAPIIKGLTLEMSKDEVEILFRVKGNDKSAFYFANEYLSPNGVKVYSFDISSYLVSIPSEFWNMRTLTLDFFNDELHSIEIKYSEARASFTNEEFKLKISESFNLSVENWTKVSGSKEQIKCKEFEIQVESGNSLTLTNLITSRKIEDSEKLKREIFKP